MGKSVIAFIPGSYMSGTERVTLEVLSYLKKTGYHVTCCISEWSDGMFPAALLNERIDFFSIKLGWLYLRKPMWSIDTILHYPLAIIKLLRKTTIKDFDWIYVASYRQVIALYPFLSQNIIYHVHEPNYNSRTSRFLIKMVDHKIHHYIAVSEFIKNDLIKCGAAEHKIHIVHNGVNMNQGGVRVSDEPNKVTIGIVGQLIPRKGHLILFEAISMLKAHLLRGKDSCLIFGDDSGAYGAKLKQEVARLDLQNVVKFMGHVSDKHQIYQAVNLIVVPSLSEAFGLIVLESYVHRVPVIASRVEGLRELIVDGETGLMFGSGNASELANKIEELISNPEMRRELTKKGYDHCAKHFDLQGSLRDVEAIFKMTG